MYLLNEFKIHSSLFFINYNSMTPFSKSDLTGLYLSYGNGAGIGGFNKAVHYSFNEFIWAGSC